jgi:hypothetical protein
VFKLSEDNIAKMHSIISNCPDWRCSYKGLVKTQKFQAWENQRMLLHGKENIQTYLKSEIYQKLCQLVKNISEQEDPVHLPTNQYCAIVRALITMFCIRTPKRSGILTRVTISQYENKEYQEKNDTYFIYVKQHKTAAAYGSSCCPITKSLVQWIDVYLTKLRPCVATTEDEILFLKHNGVPFTSGDITRELRTSWKKVQKKKTI